MSKDEISIIDSEDHIDWFQPCDFATIIAQDVWGIYTRHRRQREHDFLVQAQAAPTRAAESDRAQLALVVGVSGPVSRELLEPGSCMITTIDAAALAQIRAMLGQVSDGGVGFAKACGCTRQTAVNVIIEL